MKEFFVGRWDRQRLERLPGKGLQEVSDEISHRDSVGDGMVGHQDAHGSITMVEQRGPNQRRFLWIDGKRHLPFHLRFPL